MSDHPAVRESGARGSPVGALWLALVLLVARLTVVVAMELSHHGAPGLALVRLRESAALEAVLALVLAGLAAIVARRPRSGPAGGFVGLFLAALATAFLAGRLGQERSLSVTADTARGRLVLAGLALAASFLAVLFVSTRPRALWSRLCAPAAARLAVLLLLVLALAPRLMPSPAGEPIRLRATLVELAQAPFETLRAHPEAPPGPGVLAPSRGQEPASAGRPALLLAPPCEVLFELADAAGAWLTGGVAVDHSMEEAAAARYPGHALRFELRLDGKIAFEARVPLAGQAHWVELGAGAGLPVGAARRLGLRTVLVDAEGRELAPPDALRVGFGGLALERRETRARVRSSPSRPNLVFVLLDTLRADRTSAYGYGRATTPHLAALARRGTLFEEACASASWTWPSVASLFTGLSPEEHGVVDAVRSFLPQRLETLAEALQRAGFSTAAWSGSPLIVPAKQFDQGFEFFDASRQGFLRRADLLVPPALEWLASVRGQRFFLYLHLMEPHAPYIPLAEGRRLFAPEVPAEFDPYDMLAWQWDLRREGFDARGERRTDAVVPPREQRWTSELYDACAWSADHWVGVVLAKLAELGLEDETIVVVTSDHGEELFEHGLFAHAHALHRELVRVPLVVAGPGFEAGARVAGARSTDALAATLLARLGVEARADFPAADLLAPPGREIFFSTRQGWWNGRGNQPLYGLRQGDHTLVFAPEGEPWGGGPAGAVTLRDAARDPAEREDFAAREPELVARLRARLAARLAELGAGRVDAFDAPDAATLDMLRDIGYIGR